MIVLIDTDVLIDLALDRQPFASDAAALLDALERKNARGFVAWHTISNFYYLVAAKRGVTATRQFIDELIEFVDVAPTTTADLRTVSKLPLKDFEDAMQVGAALACAAECIATRNVRDFKNSPVPAMSPSRIVSHIS